MARSSRSNESPARSLGSASRVLGLALAVVCLAPPPARSDTILLSWTAPGDDGSAGRAASYELRYSETPVGADTTSWWNAAVSAGALPGPLAAGSRETYSVGGLAPATTYYFVIRTADEVPNWSGYSNVSIRQTGTPGGSLAAPSGFTALPAPGGVALAWDAMTGGGASGFRLYRGAVGDPNPSLLRSLSAADTAWTDTTAVGGASYEYQLAAFDATGEGPRAFASISIPGDRLLVESTLHGYPNPARGRVTLRFRAGTRDGAPGRTRVTVFDLTGRRICALLDAVLPPGERALDWNCRSDKGNPVAPGLYNVILDGPTGRTVTRVAIVP